MRTLYYGYGSDHEFDLKKWLNVAGSAFVKNLKANKAVASLFKSSIIGKIDRFLKSGLV